MSESEKPSMPDLGPLFKELDDAFKRHQPLGTIASLGNLSSLPESRQSSYEIEVDRLKLVMSYLKKYFNYAIEEGEVYDEGRRFKGFFESYRRREAETPIIFSVKRLIESITPKSLLEGAHLMLLKSKEEGDVEAIRHWELAVRVVQSANTS